MKTITKNDLATAIVASLNCTGARGAAIATEIINELKNALFLRRAIYIPSCGKITISVKAARPGRDILKGTPVEISRRHQIRMGKVAKGNTKFCKTDFISALQGQGHTAGVAWQLATLTYDFIRQNLDAGNRIELRGFGAFSTTTRNFTKARNPMDGSILPPFQRTFYTFKVSTRLRQAIDKAYL